MVQSASPQENPYEFFTNMWKGMMSPMNMKHDFMASHRKNIEVLTDANRMALDMMKNVTQVQHQYIKQAFDTLTAMMREIMASPLNHENHIPKNSEHMKQHLAKTVDHHTDIATMLSKTHKDIQEKVKNRLHDYTTEMKTMNHAYHGSGNKHQQKGN